MKHLKLLFASFGLAVCALLAQQPADTIMPQISVEKSDAEWRQTLNPEQYRVLRKKGTERPFANEYVNNHEHGVYRCAGCGHELFRSETKFDSGTGWPSFYEAISKDAVRIKQDRSFLMTREEVICANCGGHLGHVFDDGPQPTGLRYCMNSVAMKFEKQP